MQIYVQKLSNPSEEWSIDVEASDTIEGLKSKIILVEPSFVINKIKLFFPAAYSSELEDNQTISYYNIQKFAHLLCVCELYVSGTFLSQSTDPYENVSSYAKGLYKVWPDLFNGKPQWYLDNDPNKSRLWYAGAEPLGWILTIESDGSGNSISSTVLVNSPVELSSSDWDSSLIFNGILSTDLVISYENLSNNCDPIFDKFAHGNEDGCSRFRRLWSLGYV